MTGYTADEVLSGKVRWVEMTPPEWLPLDHRAIEQLKETGVAMPWEKEYLRKDGTRVPILVGVAMLDDQSGEAAAFILDLTERKRAESAIEELREEREASLQASIRLRDDFLAVAGHELKTPLTALLMQIQSLRRAIQRDSPARLAERLEKAANAGLRLERLIDQLLDVSRITAGRLSLEPEALNLADLVEDVVARFIDASIRQNDPIVVSCEPVVGRWDRLRIEQVINNLIANALKYGGESPVGIRLHHDHDTAVLEVVDRGIESTRLTSRRYFKGSSAPSPHAISAGLGWACGSPDRSSRPAVAASR